MSGCLFCKIVKGEIPGDIVYEDDNYLAFRDINPQSPVHILIIPKRHIPTILDLQPGDERIIGGLFLIARDLATKEGITEGFRTVINCNEGAGQSVFHVHMHLLGGRRMGWPPG